MVVNTMRRPVIRHAIALLAALSVAVPTLGALPSATIPLPLAQGPEMTMTEALSGKTFPLTRKLGELNGDWRRFWLHRASSANTDPVSRVLIESMQPMPILIASPVYYTQGDTVRIEGKAYLVTYVWRPQVPSPEELQNSPIGKTPPPETLTSETTIRLALISVASIRGMDGISPFDLKREMASNIMFGSSDREGLDRARTSAFNTSSLSNLKQIGLAVMMYCQDYDEKLPPLRDPTEAKRLLYPYVRNDDVFLHPSSNKPYLPNRAASRKILGNIKRPAELILFYEPDLAPDRTRGVVFADGHVKRLNETEWLNAAKYSQIPVSAPPK